MLMQFSLLQSSKKSVRNQLRKTDMNEKLKALFAKIKQIVQPLLDKLNAIPADKLRHFVIGQIVVLPFLHYPVIGMAVVIVVGAAKEVWDYVQAKAEPGSAVVDPVDFLVTVAGGALILGVAEITKHLNGLPKVLASIPTA